MKWLFSLVALPAAAAPLHSPKHSAFLASLGTPMVQVAAAMPPSPVLRLTWDYPADQITNILFEVYHAASPQAGPPLTHFDQIPQGFSLLSVVDTPPIVIGGQSQEFFIVRARDRISGVVSNWNVK